MLVYLYINGDKLVKEQLVMKSSMNISSIKTIHGSKMLQRLRSKQKILQFTGTSFHSKVVFSCI